MFKTLKGKFFFIYIVLVLLTAIVGAISIFNLLDINKAVNGMMTNNYVSIQASQHMLNALELQNTAMLTYIYDDDSKSPGSFIDSNVTFMKYYNLEAHHITEKGEKDVVEKINMNYSGFEKTFPELQKLRDTKDETAAFNYYHTAIIPVFTQINSDLNKIILLNQTSMLNNKAQTSESARASLTILFLISLFAVVSGFYVSRHFVFKFLHPLQQMTNSVSRMKGGKLDLKLEITTDDEIGKLANEFNEMTGRLRSYEQSAKGQLIIERNKSVAIVKSISDPLLVLDSKFKIILMNSASETFFSISEEKALNKHFLESICDGELFDIIMDCVGNGAARTQKIIKVEKDGENLYFNISVIAIKSETESGYIFLMHNVTELKELEQVKTDFIATISHEIKTPLTAVIMGTSLLENGGLGSLNEEQNEVLNTVMENAQRLADFVSELLELSKIESGKSVYTLEACSINAVISNSLSQYLEAAQKSGISISGPLRYDLPPVYADFEKITWVLNNLINNALKYTKSGGLITIDAGPQAEEMVVSVADTGEGIPPEFIDRVFDKYVQVKTQDIEARGTGLGLSVARDIVAAHKGRIWVESKLGHGSKFIFTLPLYKEELH